MLAALIAVSLATAACGPAEMNGEAAADVESADAASVGRADARGGTPEDQSFGPCDGAQDLMVVNFETQLLTAYETPPSNPASTPEAKVHGKGFLRLTVATDPDGDIINVFPKLDFELCGIQGQFFTLSKVDVHAGAANVRGPVAINTRVSEAKPLTLPVFDGCVLPAFPLSGIPGPGQDLNDIAAQIIEDPAVFYFEVHTPTNPNGLARGQLMSALPDDP